MDRSQTITGLFAILFGGWIVAETYTSFKISVSSHIGGGIDAAGYPRLLGVLAVSVGVLLLASGVLAKGGNAGRRSAGRLWAPALLCVILAAYFQTLLLFGYMLATPFLVSAVLLLANERRPIVIAAVSVAATAAFGLLFEFGAGLLLPDGRLVSLGI